MKKSACRRTTSSAGAAGGKSFKSSFFSQELQQGKLSRAMAAREATSEAAPRCRAAGSRNPWQSHEKTPGVPKPRQRRAPGRNRARGHPLQRRTQDHRATSPVAGPRRARGSTAAARPQPQKRANLARGKFCDFSPDLGFEWRGRFSSLREARRAANETPGRAHTLSTSS